MYFGVEYPPNGVAPACQRGDDVLTSNVGVNQHMFSIRDVTVDYVFRHRSCVVGDDREVINMLGAQATWRFDWNRRTQRY